MMKGQLESNSSLVPAIHSRTFLTVLDEPSNFGMKRIAEPSQQLKHLGRHRLLLPSEWVVPARTIYSHWIVGECDA
jgi:hypothetical protein